MLDQPTKPNALSEVEKQVGSNGTSNFVAWIVKRRITLSLILFTLLIALNLLVFRTRPYLPFDRQQLGSVVGTSLAIAGLAIRSWAAGTLHKSSEVTTIGPYSLVRNPLYVGSFLMIFGFCILMKDWLSLAFALGPLAVLYWFQVRAEERYLSTRFGEAWSEYANKTGRFLPCSLTNQFLLGWSAAQWLRNREYQAMFATVIALAGLCALATFQS